MDKLLKKSVEVVNIESSVNQNNEKSRQTKVNQVSRRKIVRKYDYLYLKLGFTWNGDEEDPQPRCVICYDQLANESMRPNKLRRHIETKHPELKENPLVVFESMLTKLKSGQSLMQHCTKLNEKTLYALYLISLRIAKADKTHTIGETLVLPAIKDTVKVFFGDKSEQEIESVSLSNITVTRRIDEMSEWVENQVIERVRESPLISLQLDESADVQGLCQLLVFIRYIWNSDSHEDMLFCEPISRCTSDEIFNAVDLYIKSEDLDWNKRVGICTDGAMF